LTVLVAGDQHAALLTALPSSVKRRPVFGDRVVEPLLRDPLLPSRAFGGVVVVSPVPGVGGRLWLETVAAAVRRFGVGVIDRALTTGGFAVVAELAGPLAGFVTCEVCGDLLTESGVTGHRARSTRCRWLVAHRTVEDAWAGGWRDPGSLADVPTRWDELSRGRWRRFVRLVEYPQWTAVLVDPAQRLRPEGPVLVSPGERRR